MAEKEENIPLKVKEELKRGKEIKGRFKETQKEEHIEKRLECKEKKRIEDYERNIMKGEGTYQHIKKAKMLGGKGWVRFHPSKAKMRKKTEEKADS